MELQPRRMIFSTRNQSLVTRSSYRSVNSSKSTKPPYELPPCITSFNNKKIQNLNSRNQSGKFLSLSSTCWCLYDAETNTELGFRQHYQREVASLTKIMTTIVGLQLKKQFKLSPNLLIKVTEGSTKNVGTTANLKNNHWISLKDIFYGIMLPSGNDAAHLLAEVLGYLLYYEGKYSFQALEKLRELDITSKNTTFFIAEFIKAMNRKAEELRLIQTRFSNSHGLQNAMNISTARDILQLSRYASKNPIFRKIMNCQFHRCIIWNEEQTKKDIKLWQNTNVLLKEDWEGVKTGQTLSAGSCLSSVKNNIFIVVLNCPDSVRRFTETKRLYQWYTEKRKVINETFSTQNQQY